MPKPSKRGQSIVKTLTVAKAQSYTGQLSAGQGTTYYVATTGSDSNTGTEASPWATFHKAASTLLAGDTAIFEDGTYNETQQGVITHSGTASRRITLRARNQHAAVINFQGLQTVWGHMYTRQSYVTVRDFEITEDSKGSTANDVLVYFDNTTGVLADPASTNNEFIGNKVHGAYFNTLKVYKSDNFLAEGNELYDTDGLACVGTNLFGMVFRNNRIYDVTTLAPASGAALQFKGGVRSVQVYDNVFRVKTGKTTSVAFVIGGDSSANAVYDSSTSGYEAFNCVFYNNVAISEDIGSLEYAYLFSGARDCLLYNNVAIGAVWSIYTTKGNGDQAAGWAWDPLTKNPIIENNVVLDAEYSVSHSTINFSFIEGSVTNDYNCYYNSGSPPSDPPTEAHGVYADPLFVNKASDWDLQGGSPFVPGAARTFTGFLGEMISVHSYSGLSD